MDKNPSILQQRRSLWFMFIILISQVLSSDASSDIRLNKCSDYPEETEGSSGGENQSSSDLWIVPKSLMTDNSEVEFRLERNENFSCILYPDIYTINIISSSKEETVLEFQDVNGTDFTPSGNHTYSIPSHENDSYPDVDSDVFQPIIQFTPRGVLVIDGEYFRSDEYCIQRISNSKVTVRICKMNCEDEKTPCIPICCSIDKALVLNGTHASCHLSGPNQYSPTFYEDIYTKVEPEISSEMRPHFVKTFPHCGPGGLIPFPFRKIHNISKTAVRVLKTGKVKILGRERRWRDLEQYCLTGLQNFGDGPYYSGKEEDQLVYTCWDEYNTNEVVAPQFYIPTFFVGSIFLFITALVYILLWEKQNVHGWTVLSFVLSMFFLFIFLAWSHLLGLFYRSWEFSGTFMCTFVGILTHFFFLSTFCWLSVINFDLWWTFKSMAPVSGRSKGVKRFICYLLFAWGVPGIIICIGIILKHIFSDPESEVIIPDYGTVDCFLSYEAKGVYLYYIIGFLLVVNLMFICLTLYTIYKFKEGTRAVDAARSNNSQNLSVKLFIKLFVLMGATWIFELISWWLVAEAAVWYWVIFDMFNLFQSIGIFFIFVCKRKILNQLEQKYPSLKVITGPLKKITLTRRATRSITTTTGMETHVTRTSGFSGRKFQTSSNSKL